jgi:hypothetical protein
MTRTTVTFTAIGTRRVYAVAMGDGTFNRFPASVTRLSGQREVVWTWRKMGGTSEGKNALSIAYNNGDPWAE